jgi:NitT/TauT family transport system substrate-binding protein
LEINVIRVSDALSMVSNGIVTNETTLKNKPELVRGFVRALLRGVADAIADPDLAFTTSTKFVEGLGRDPKNDAIQRQVLAESIKLWQGGAPGRSDPVAWDTTQDVLVSMGLIKEKFDNAQLFTNQFVDEVK